MFLMRGPGPARIQRELRRASTSKLNDPRLEGLGALELLGAGTAASNPAREFRADAYGARLGSGPACFDAGARALRAWAMYPPGWTRVHEEGGRWRAGGVYLAQVDHFGFCSLLPGRIVAVDDEPRCVGYTFATLEGHAEAGVERFRVEWDVDTDVVEYRAVAASRPVGIARLAAPIARRLQIRFHRASSASMRAATARLG